MKWTKEKQRRMFKLARAKLSPDMGESFDLIVAKHALKWWARQRLRVWFHGDSLGPFRLKRWDRQRLGVVP